MRILLVDDENETFVILNGLLGKLFEIVQCPSKQAALSSLDRGECDLILLDVNLADGEDGFAIFTDLRTHPKLVDVPIIFLTGRGHLNDRIAGFSLGADDYITKPFEPRELKARIESRIALAKSRKAEARVFRKGRIELDHPQMRAFILDQKALTRKDMLLTPIEFRILYYFLTNEGNVLSRDQLITAAWGHDTHVLERTVDRHVSSLRRKLNPKIEKIEAVHGMGYRFVQKS